MSPEALTSQTTTTINESNLVETKNTFPPTPTAPAQVAPTSISKLNTPDAIFSIVPINTDTYGPYGKPNAIVRPLRRNESIEMTLPQANDVQIPASSGQSTPKAVDIPPKTNKKRKIDTFTKELDNNLRHLRYLQHTKNSSKNVTLLNLFLKFIFNFERYLKNVPFSMVGGVCVNVCVRQAILFLWYYYYQVF